MFRLPDEPLLRDQDRARRCRVWIHTHHSRSDMGGRDWRRVTQRSTPADVLAGALRGKEPRPADGYDRCMACQESLDGRSTFRRRAKGPGYVHDLCPPTEI